MNVARRFWGIVAVGLLLTFLSTAHAKYSGGTGEPNDPYQIATAADLVALGETPEDYDKHFILTADIDLDPNLPGGTLFDRAIIAPDVDPCESGFQGASFTGVFDGNGYVLSHVTVQGRDYVGLFGQLEAGAEVRNLRLRDVSITGSGYVGGLAGFSRADVTLCHTTGRVAGDQRVGGLVARSWGHIAVSGSAASVTGNEDVGGLVANNYGNIADSYTTGTVTGSRDVGGLAGENYGSISTSYSAGAVAGVISVGGLVGYNWDEAGVVAGFWDTNSSGQAASAGGTGKTTAEIQTARTFLDAGWDFTGETANGMANIWAICEGRGYPRFTWEQVNCGDSNQPASTVFFPDYAVMYGTRTFQWTYGKAGEWTSLIAGSLGVPYGEGVVTGIEITNAYIVRTQLWNDGGYNDGLTAGPLSLGNYYFSSDPDLTSYPSQWSWGWVTDGMLVDVRPYYLVKSDRAQVLLIDYQLQICTVQDVSVLAGHYTDALVLWVVDTRYPYVALNFLGHDARLGIVLPTALDTAGYAVTGLRIRGRHVGTIALGSVVAQTGRLEYLGELKRIDMP